MFYEVSNVAFSFHVIGFRTAGSSFMKTLINAFALSFKGTNEWITQWMSQWFDPSMNWAINQYSFIQKKHDGTDANIGFLR